MCKSKAFLSKMRCWLEWMHIILSYILCVRQVLLGRSAQQDQQWWSCFEVTQTYSTPLGTHAYQHNTAHSISWHIMFSDIDQSNQSTAFDFICILQHWTLQNVRFSRDLKIDVFSLLRTFLVTVHPLVGPREKNEVTPASSKTSCFLWAFQTDPLVRSLHVIQPERFTIPKEWLK